MKRPSPVRPDSGRDRKVYFTLGTRASGLARNAAPPWPPDDDEGIRHHRPSAPRPSAAPSPIGGRFITTKPERSKWIAASTCWLIIAGIACSISVTVCDNILSMPNMRPIFSAISAGKAVGAEAPRRHATKTLISIARTAEAFAASDKMEMRSACSSLSQYSSVGRPPLGPEVFATVARTRVDSLAVR
jgi:hypothetical protein